MKDDDKIVGFPKDNPRVAKAPEGVSKESLLEAEKALMEDLDNLLLKYSNRVSTVSIVGALQTMVTIITIETYKGRG